MNGLPPEQNGINNDDDDSSEEDKSIGKQKSIDTDDDDEETMSEIAIDEFIMENDNYGVPIENPSSTRRPLHHFKRSNIGHNDDDEKTKELRYNKLKRDLEMAEEMHALEVEERKKRIAQKEAEHEQNVAEHNMKMKMMQAKLYKVSSTSP